MAADFLHSVLVQDEAQSADGTVTYDLPINPLSHILLTIKAANVTPIGSISDYSVLTQLLLMNTRVEILFRGSAIMSGSLRDLAMLSMILTGRELWQGQVDDVDNNIRSVTVPIMLGRRLYDVEECFPMTRRGELTLQLTTDVALTGLDTLIHQIETVELLNARPMRHMRVTTASKTPSATGFDDLDLPIGNILAGILLFGTTVPTGSVYTASFNQIEFLLNSVQKYFTRTNWETLHGMLQQRLDPLSLNDHAHALTALAGTTVAAEAVQMDASTGALETSTSGAATTNIAGGTSGIMRQALVQSSLENYAYMDFDPRGDLQFAPDTVGASRVHLRIDHGAADAVRVLPVEIVRV